jgi:hypothetical protein
MINPAIELDFENGQIQGVLLGATYEVQIPPNVNTGTLGSLVRLVLASDHRNVQLAPWSCCRTSAQPYELSTAWG